MNGGDEQQIAVQLHLMTEIEPAKTGADTPVPFPPQGEIVQPSKQDGAHPRPVSEGKVCIQRIRVDCEIARVIELRRVDVDAEDRVIALRDRTLQQRSMAFMQRAHGRHEADRAFLAFPPGPNR